MNKLTIIATGGAFRRRATVEVVGVNLDARVVTFPRFTGYRRTPYVRCDFGTHATRGAGIGGRSAIHLDDIGAAGVKLVTDTDVFHRSVGDVNQGNQAEAEDTGIINTCTRDPIRTEAEAIARLGSCVSEEGERTHVSAFAAGAAACCDTYVNSPESGTADVIERFVYGAHPKGLFKDCSAATCRACAAIQWRRVDTVVLDRHACEVAETVGVYEFRCSRTIA